MNKLVLIRDGLAVTTSLAIADGTDNQHKNVMELVRSYLADLQEFGGVAFETRPFETAGGVQQREIAILNEQHATLLLTYMRNSEIVRQFKKRLVHEFYELAQQARAPAFAIPQTMPEALRLAAEALEQKAVAEAKVVALEQKVDEIEPKAKALDRISARPGTSTFTEVAKKLEIPRREFITRLHAAGWIYRQNGSWLPYQRFIDAGLLQYKEGRYGEDDEDQHSRRPYCHFTEKGVNAIARKLSVKAA